jgi:hypothetical protein
MELISTIFDPSSYIPSFLVVASVFNNLFQQISWVIRRKTGISRMSLSILRRRSINVAPLNPRRSGLSNDALIINKEYEYNANLMVHNVAYVKELEELFEKYWLLPIYMTPRHIRQSPLFAIIYIGRQKWVHCNVSAGRPRGSNTILKIVTRVAQWAAPPLIQSWRRRYV